MEMSFENITMTWLIGFFPGWQYYPLPLANQKKVMLVEGTNLEPKYYVDPITTEFQAK